MLIGVPKEIKDNEYRVGLIPSSVRELTAKGHRVLVEQGAGLGAGLTDDDYKAAGAEIAAQSAAVYAQTELIVKVKEPLAAERKRLRKGQVLFTYLHLAADRALTEDLIAAGVTAIAYETVTSPQGSLPLLTPMSEVAGRMGRRMWVRAAWRKRTAGAACCSAACPAFRRRMCWCLAVASPARTRRSSRPAWAPPSR
jgi:alanine dehydrogenase